ncbi:hypothetical protein C7380_10268 [Oceanotoga teriensis]|uniref:Uncharacterized protein n=1 Tax=Oceanotoga teriensis TaxID=515440 RepID=A0AA45C8F2_9BACT|nr:ATPase [Oceanotoga teriensis]PWJ96159.1 hypothetical protein C7380_10268 [Oceanotoga teriensis]
MRSFIIPGEVSYNSNSQILNSAFFRELICELINDSEEKKNSLYPFFELFKKDFDTLNPEEKYDIDAIIQLMISLSVNTVEHIDASGYYAFPKLGTRKDLLIKFVERLFNSWRNKHRFMVKQSRFTQDSFNRINKQMMVVKNNADLKSLVLSLYRQILVNINETKLKVLRQLPSGAQVGFITDNPEIKEEYKFKNAQWIYDMKFVWSTVFEPPVIFYTKSNKRRGLFKVIDKPILDKVKIENLNDYLLFPIHVNSKLIYVIVYKEYLSHAAGLGNLFEIASFNVVNNKKPDGIYIFGMKNDFFEENDDYNGIIYKEEDGTYIGMVGDDPSIDYFGYMKKMILTIHNLLVIDEKRIPIHGALAQIKLRDGRSFNVMIMGDSGAGKSETLDALNRLKEEVSEVNILIDDMGSLDIQDGKIVAYGTETGAFVRLDDLQPGYAYSAMDRSIFMNPNEINARVIVPYSNYEDIIKPTEIDYFLYANNYEKINKNEESVYFYENVDNAYEIFSKGARMAKGTTAEKGLTYSYFANPFGAIQRKEVHEKIAKIYMEAMINSGVKVGAIKTQLGIPGFEENGPIIAAKGLLNLLHK